MIFVDTSFWVALAFRDDPNHGAAQALNALHAQRMRIATNHVRGETWTFLRRRAGHAVAVKVLDAMETSPRLQIAHVDREMEGLALGWLRRRDEREYSFVDATSFAVMVDFGIQEAFAFDGDFSAAGFLELRP